MRAPRWTTAVALLTSLAGTALALPGDGPTGAGRDNRPKDGFDYFGKGPITILVIFLVVCFIAGAIAKARKGRSK